MSLAKKIMMLVAVLSVVILTAITITFALLPKTYHDAVTIQSIAPIPSTLTSSRYTQMDDLRIIDENPYTSLDEHELIGVEPVNNLALYVHPGYLSLRVLNLNTGYVWASNMSYDYLHSDHPLYDPADIGSDYYLDPEYDETRNPFVREDRSPVVITYYNTLSTNNLRVTEYFFENILSGTINRQELTNQIGFNAKMTMPLSGIKFDMKVYLDETGLHVEIPFDSIEDNNNFVLSTITVYRYFGFTKQDYTPGYVFIPDGVGALIRYDSTNISPYVKKFYGPDYTLNEFNPEQSLTASVYGLVQGVHQNAMLGIVASGAGNASFSYVPANNQQTNFNRAQVVFEYRNTYIQKLNASGTSTIERIQTNKSPFDIHMIYVFLENDQANYVGLANRYRDYLIDNDYQIEPLAPATKIPLHLDVLAAENKSVWYGREVFSMTTTHQLIQMINDLKHNDVGHLDIAVHGWQRGGQGYTSPNFGSYEGKFGIPWDLYDVDGVDIYYGMTPLFADRNTGGYNSNQIAQTQGSELVGGETAYLIKIDAALNIFMENYNSIFRHGVRNISLVDFAFVLYSDYSNGIKSRSEYIETMRSYLSVGEKTTVDKPFDYLWDADVISDIHLYSSGQLKFTDTVPFIPIVLAGFKHVYGRSGNFFANTSNELLRMIDYHVFPNFYMTHESAKLLLNTSTNYIFTSRYGDWQEEIIRQYNYINDALSPVYNAHFVSREILLPGVVKNTYSNGVVIYVNYSGNDVNVDGTLIAAMDYEVVL